METANAWMKLWYAAKSHGFKLPVEVGIVFQGTKVGLNQSQALPEALPLNGRGERIRTSDLFVPNEAR